MLNSQLLLVIPRQGHTHAWLRASPLNNSPSLSHTALTQQACSRLGSHTFPRKGHQQRSLRFLSPHVPWPCGGLSQAGTWQREGEDKLPSKLQMQQLKRGQRQWSFKLPHLYNLPFIFCFMKFYFLLFIHLPALPFPHLYSSLAVDMLRWILSLGLGLATPTPQSPSLAGCWEKAPAPPPLSPLLSHPGPLGAATLQILMF